MSAPLLLSLEIVARPWAALLQDINDDCVVVQRSIGMLVRGGLCDAHQEDAACSEAAALHLFDVAEDPSNDAG